MMKRTYRHWAGPALALTLLLGLAASVQAAPPEWAGKGGGKHGGDRQERQSQSQREGEARQQPRAGRFFKDRQRSEVQSYYREQARGGNCPPGLAKKKNGCLPPGQARKWQMGQALPRDVQTYPVEPEVQVRLGVPPAGHEFVRVASDILLIAAGTGMVIDAIQDLGR